MKKPKNDFVHLHVHSDMSQLDGCGKIADYAEKAKSMGHSAIAFTEHGTMRQYYTQLEECESRGLKPIYGIEFYVSGNMRRKGLTEEEKKLITSGLKKSEHKSALKRYEEREGIRDRWHLTVLAKNEVGLKNLFKLSTNAWLEGFYYKPRIDLDELIKYKDGLIVATGCQASIINDHVCVGKRKKALNIADRLCSEFGSELWLEVMPHEGNDQILSNKFAMELMERWDKRIGMIATQDAHYVDKTDADAHEVLLCIGTRDNISNPDRFKFGDGELYLKSRKEMFDSFMKYHSYMGSKLIKRSLNSTLDVADEIQNKIIKIDRFACLMPPVDVPDKFGGDEYSYTKALCIHGWTWREIPKRASFYAKKHGMSYENAIKIYKQRLKHELGSIKRQKFITYFLLVRDLYNWARKQDIMCGPGRGSAAGSLVAFLLGITSVDPIEHGLLFERFINPARVDMPDIDMDFEDVRRQEIIEYLRQKYGGDRVSQIATIGKLSGKQCLKDISRVLKVPYVEVNRVTNSIIERSSGDERASQTIEDSFRDFKICREFNKKYPDVLKYAKVLEGMNKNLGIHAAGVVTSPVPLVEVVPLEVRKHKEGDVIVTAVDMNGVQAHGLLKLDVLGLRTLTVLKDTLRAVKENTGKEIDLERLTLDDKKVLRSFTDHDYVGIFQYDSPGADKICNGVEFDDFTDVAAMTALNRPGTARSGLATEYVERKKHPEKRKVGHFHPKVSEITSDTMGVIVYQEHVQKIFVEIAGFPPGTADSLRRVIAKKYGDETIGKERENFLKGAREHSGIDEKTAGKIMDAITFFGCLEYDTKIYTPGGWKEIYKLKEGDSIYSYDGNEIVENTIKTIGCSGTKPVFSIETDNGRVNASENHWWRLENGKYVKTKELCLGDKLLSPFSNNSIVSLARRVGKVDTWDLECIGEPANYITMVGACHNSYGFNKTVCSSAYVLRAGANQHTNSPWMTVGELYEAFNSRTEGVIHPYTKYCTGGQRTPIANKMRNGNFRLVSMDDDFRCRPNIFKNIYDHGINDVYEIVMKDGSRTPGFSKSHRLMTVDGYKIVGQLEKGDELIFMDKEYDFKGWGKDYDSTWSQKGRQSSDWDNTVYAVWKRAKGVCEECGKPGIEGRGGHEVAHIKSPSECDYNRKVFHCLGNLRLLCNSCHKKMDYEKGERTKRWRRGRKTYSMEVERVEYVGAQHCYDIEMEGPDNNYVASKQPEGPAVISHNSHATSYGIMAYWGMWLKVYYPLEFYWALLKNTPDRIRIQGFAKDAKRHGIELLPPDVSVSRREFTIDRSRNAIRGSLVDIKNIGEKAADSIMNNQPYKDYIDFISRIDRRRVNKRVLVSLAKSGSLDSLVPNVKWYIENIDELNIDVDKKHVVKELLDKFEKSKKLENYSEEERQLVSSQVNPLAFGKHPIDAYEDFIKNNVKVELHKMSDEDFWDNYDGENIFIYGVIIEVKYNRIGDFHSGELPPEEEREMMFWGQRYANVNVEDSGGSQNRMKFDIDIFDDMRELIDTGIGTPVVIHAMPNKKYENLNANFAVDLEKYRKKLINGDKLNVWENIIYGNHPALTKKWKPTSKFDCEQIKIQRVKNELFFKGKTKKFTGIVIRRRLKCDKNGNLMSFFNMMDAECNTVSCICFASSWNKEIENVIKYGNFLSIELDRQPDIRNKGNWQYFFNGGGIKWYKKSFSAHYIR
jgi:DNA-directed DNA polymerase III PolC